MLRPLLDYIAENQWAAIVATISLLGSGLSIAYWAGRRSREDEAAALRIRLDDKNDQLANVTDKMEKVVKENADLKRRNDEIFNEQERLKEIGVHREWLFFVHDPAPRMPLCPRCHADGRTVRMAFHHAGLSEPKYMLKFLCIKCMYNVIIDTRDYADPLFETLGLSDTLKGIWDEVEAEMKAQAQSKRIIKQAVDSFFTGNSEKE